MTDIRIVRTRPGVRIYLNQEDLTDIMTQDDVVKSFNSEELKKIVFTLSTELQDRENGPEHS